MLDTINKEGQSILHVACDKGCKDIVLFLLMSGIDPTIKNNSGQKAGDTNIEIKMFINNIVAENKVFDVLKPQHKQKLQQIFEDIDFDNQKSIDMQKATQFNKFIEDGVSDSIADRDAKDFIKTTAICNSLTANIDEWMFAFAKTLAVD